MCIATTKQKIQGKLNDRGTLCVFFGYPKSHANEVYRLLNLKTSHIVKSRDIIWLNKGYGEWINSMDSVEKVGDDLSDSESEKDATKEQMKSPTRKDKSAYNEKVLRENSKLNSGYNLIHQDLLRQKIQEGTW